MSGASAAFIPTIVSPELLQHLPDCRTRLIRRYGLYSSLSRGIWLRQPHLARLAPEGWKQDHSPQSPIHIGPADQQYAEASVSAREYRTVWARLIAKVYEADPPLECGRCGHPMHVVAVITEPQQVVKILRHLVKTKKAPLDLDLACVD